jgi:hypothetical protein
MKRRNFFKAIGAGAVAGVAAQAVQAKGSSKIVLEPKGEPPKTTTHDTGYVIGRGKLYFAELDASGSPTGWRHIHTSHVASGRPLYKSFKEGGLV